MKLLILTILLPIFFVACASKSQNDMIDSNKEDISKLLDTLIEKEKEINELNKKLEDCRNIKITQ